MREMKILGEVDTEVDRRAAAEVGFFCSRECREGDLEMSQRARAIAFLELPEPAAKPGSDPLSRMPRDGTDAEPDDERKRARDQVAEPAPVDLFGIPHGASRWLSSTLEGERLQHPLPVATGPQDRLDQLPDRSRAPATG